MFHQNYDFIGENQASDFQQSGNHLSTLDSAASNVVCYQSHSELQAYHFQSKTYSPPLIMSPQEHVNQLGLGSTNDQESADSLNSKSLGRNRSISNESFSTSTSSEIGKSK